MKTKGKNNIGENTYQGSHGEPNHNHFNLGFNNLIGAAQPPDHEVYRPKEINDNVGKVEPVEGTEVGNEFAINNLFVGINERSKEGYPKKDCPFNSEEEGKRTALPEFGEFTGKEHSQDYRYSYRRKIGSSNKGKVGQVTRPIEHEESNQPAKQKESEKREKLVKAAGAAFKVNKETESPQE